MLTKYKPVIISILTLLFAVGCVVTVVKYGGKSHHHKVTTTNTSASNMNVAEVGFSLARVLNAQPPTTNKIIAETGCALSNGVYKCLFIGNSSGRLYCAFYQFTVDASQRVKIQVARVIPSTNCGL